MRKAGVVWGIFMAGIAGVFGCSEPQDEAGLSRPVVEEPAETGMPVTDLTGAIEPLPIFGDWVSNHYRERTAMFSQREVEPGGIAMVGDSITEEGDWSQLMPGGNAVNFGISGDTSAGVLQRLGQIKEVQPSTVLLMIGTNDLGNHDIPVQEIGDNVEAVLEELMTFMDSDDIYVQSVLPRDPSFTARVRALNERLMHEAYMRGTWFVFLDDAFWDESWTQLDPSVTDDGLHLNAAGYARWVDFLQPYLDMFPVVPGTDIAIPAHYPPGGKTHYARRAAEFEARDVSPGRIAFVGDSITEGGDWALMFPELETVNFGIGWDQTSGLLNRMEQIERATPSRVVLMIGTNDIGNGRPVADAAANNHQAIRRFKGFVTAENILLQSVPPRGAELNAEVLEMNARLERIAAEEGVDWLNIYEPFVVEDRLDPAVTEDSLHFTAAGYDRWQGLLEPWLAR
ncbi:hypothetical protein GCM10011342_13770 [Aquisalinus flavus]|uniref:SGNH hydrolase-type esterase domain-containing protein n=2 Tax=Aquisalinus flavus TaxID=1526572 RepID=A0A8J2V4B8_9PROT|nr:hypothetical protein GCM10011342_13770 [Aquisalinus flavus]